ncbi:MAG: ABC transporter substrate-binding protein [Bacteriovoracaceae bacterium]
MLEVGITHLPKTLDPTKLAFMEHFLLLQCTSQTLVRISEKGTIVGDLAKKWKIKENGSVYEFEIVKDAFFHHLKKRVTAKDVAISISRHFWHNSMVAGYLKPLLAEDKTIKKGKIHKSIQVLSPTKLSIKLIKPYPPFLHVLSMPGFAILSKEDHRFSGPMTNNFNSKSKRWEFNKNELYKGNLPELNSISVRSIETTRKAFQLFKKGLLDIALGLPLSELENLSLPKNTLITKSRSLAIAHMYFNATSKLFLKKEIRKDIASLIMQEARFSSNKSFLHEISPTFLPKGVMPLKYYKREKYVTSINEVKKRWGRSLSHKKINIVLMKSVFTDSFFDSITEIFHKLGAEINLIKATPNTLVKHMANNNYDIIGGRYFGNFPDPDGFIDIIKPTSPLRYGVFPNNHFFEKINDIRFTTDQSMRLNLYSSAFREFEDQWFIIPLYRINVPVIHRKAITIPETNFRYESELWKILWSTKKEVEN